MSSNIDRVLRDHELPINIFEGAVVYDLGCGYNDLAADLEERGIRATVTGFDENLDLLQEARQGNPVTKLVFAHLDNLPVADASADMVLATYSLPLWGRDAQEIVSFFRECTRVVRPDGMLSICPVEKTPRKNPHPMEQAMVACVHQIIESPEWITISTKPKVHTAIKR